MSLAFSWSGHMPKIDPLQQQEFFDGGRQNYSEARILRPPLHTRREIAIILNRLHDVRTGTMVVDFGAGSGRLTIPLLQVGFSVLAIDVSAASLARLCSTATALGLNGVQTASALPAGQKFAAVVGTDILSRSAHGQAPSAGSTIGLEGFPGCASSPIASSSRRREAPRLLPRQHVARR
jgi:2-polyprenyl-3-methyl-5-hydroxy-6-metoxy-1,4-benzoquinol methylase